MLSAFHSFSQHLLLMSARNFSAKLSVMLRTKSASGASGHDGGSLFAVLCPLCPKSVQGGSHLENDLGMKTRDLVFVLPSPGILAESFEPLISLNNLVLHYIITTPKSYKCLSEVLFKAPFKLKLICLSFFLAHQLSLGLWRN